MDGVTLPSCLEEWGSLTDEYNALETVHKEYLKKVEEIQEIQEKCLKGITHQRYRMGQIRTNVESVKKKTKVVDEKIKSIKLEKEMMKRRTQIEDMQKDLPNKNGLYLKIVLGNVNVSIINKQERFRYKDEYEKFKLYVTAVDFVLCLMNILFWNYKLMDLVLIFLLVWYYCTLTIRESILKVNGSRIKGWWRLHHFISTACSAILLIWPAGESYELFRNTFLSFNAYIAFVQFLQFFYQRGCLYRLKALGERHNMDITIEGFHSWMWRGLSFVLPFVYGGYAYQLYCAYSLYQISKLELCTEWQVQVLSALFFVLFTGNLITTSLVIPQKIREKITFKYRIPSLWKKFKSGSSGNSPDRENADSPTDRKSR